MSGSVPFDQAAERYDATRALTSEASAELTGLLGGELDTRGRCLEIGVGTGLIALPLHDAGVPMYGVDLSRPMLGKLVEKAGGGPPFPLVLGDATALPFADGAFGGAIGRHVLHLIASWRDALGELVRVVEAGGIVLLNIGVTGGPFHEVTEHLEAVVGRTAQRIGLQADQTRELDDAMASLGARFRELPPVWQESDETIATYLADVRAGVPSWTWTVDLRVLTAAVEQTRAWAMERFGAVDVNLEPRFPVVFRAYDLP